MLFIDIEDSALFRGVYLNVNEGVINEYVYCFVQKVRFSSCLISSVEACDQTTLWRIWSEVDRQVLHRLECTLPLEQKGDGADTKKLWSSCKY